MCVWVVSAHWSGSLPFSHSSFTFSFLFFSLFFSISSLSQSDSFFPIISVLCAFSLSSSFLSYFFSSSLLFPSLNCTHICSFFSSSYSLLSLHFLPLPLLPFLILSFLTLLFFTPYHASLPLSILLLLPPFLIFLLFSYRLHIFYISIPSFFSFSLPYKPTLPPFHFLYSPSFCSLSPLGLGSVRRDVGSDGWRHVVSNPSAIA